MTSGRGRVLLSILLLTAVFAGAPATARETTKAQPSPPTAEDSDVADIVAAGLAGTQPAQGTLASGVEPSVAEKQLQDAYVAAAKFQYVNRTNAFAWQAVTTKIIFVLVLIVVVFGVILTALQFTRSSTAVTALKASTGGVEITSPVIGVVILTLSLGFFYLYLANVYPITEVKSGPAAETQSRPQAPASGSRTRLA